MSNGTFRRQAGCKDLGFKRNKQARGAYQRIVDGKAAIYHADESEKQPIDDDEKESGWHKLYKHLMNGVSHMLPFVVGGGVLIALGFLFDTLAGNADVGGTFGFTSPVAAIVFWIGKAAFALMLPILSAYIASSVADRPGLLPGMIGGVFAANGYTFSSLIETKALPETTKRCRAFSVLCSQVSLPVLL